MEILFLIGGFFLLFILLLHSILSFEILYLYSHKKEKPPFFYGGSVIYTYTRDWLLPDESIVLHK